jgi:methionyl-tRNA formyltransferase
LSKDDGRIEWTQPALAVERAVRAFDPWPGAWTTWQNQQLKIGSARVDADWTGTEAPGTVLDGAVLRVATGSGALEIVELQPAGKRMMAARDWLRGQRDVVGQRLGNGEDR